jgi:spore maturation protein SpmB
MGNSSNYQYIWIIISFFSLSAYNIYSVSQVTVLSSIILIAHAFPIELRIAQKAGIRIWFMFILRFFCAIILGFILNFIFNTFNLYKGQAVILLNPRVQNNSIIDWLIREIRIYSMIFLIIFILLSIIKFLEKTGFIKKLNSFLEPGLKIIGLSKDAAPVSIIGTTLGISYGGGLIINESKNKNLSKKDIFLSLSMMGLTHSIIEDTLLMLTIGAALSGILFGRIFFTIIIMILLIKLINFIPKSFFNKYFLRKI